MAQGFANGETEYVDNLKQALGSITQGQLDSAADLAIAQGFGANGPVVAAIVGALLGAEEQFRKAQRGVLAMGQDDMNQVREGRGMTDLDHNVNQLAITMQKFKKTMDVINSGLLNSSLVGAGMAKLEEVINGTQEFLDRAVETATNQMNSNSNPAQQTVDAAVAVTEALFDTIIEKLQGLINSINPLSLSSGLPAVPTAPSQASASLSLPTAPLPDVANAALPDASNSPVQSANANSRITLDPDVADAIKNTPIMLSQLAAAVKRDGQENTRELSNAIRLIS
jgi:hypothetical protein